MADDRAAIAAAASSVDGVDCTPRFRQVTRPGQAVVQLSRQDRPSNGFGRMNVWQVFVVLPADRARAESWLDERLDELVAALEDPAALAVTTVTPITVPTPSGDINGVAIEGTRPSG